MWSSYNTAKYLCTKARDKLCSVCEDICPDEHKKEDDDDDTFCGADRDIIITTSRRRRPVLKRQQRRQRRSQTTANTTSENKKNENNNASSNQSGRGFAGEMGKYLASFVLGDTSARIADRVLPALQIGGINPFARVVLDKPRVSFETRVCEV